MHRVTDRSLSFKGPDSGQLGGFVELDFLTPFRSCLLTWNVDDGREEEGEVGVSGELRGDEGQSVEAEESREPAAAEDDEARQEDAVLQEVHNRLLLFGLATRFVRFLNSGNGAKLSSSRSQTRSVIGNLFHKIFRSRKRRWREKSTENLKSERSITKKIQKSR